MCAGARSQGKNVIAIGGMRIGKARYRSRASLLEQFRKLITNTKVAPLQLCIKDGKIETRVSMLDIVSLSGSTFLLE